MPPSASTADAAATLRTASEPQFLRKLDRLRFVRQPSVSGLPGPTPVTRLTQPSGLEVANHKPYAPGDDLRHLDWNAYGRLDQRVIKTFQAEREAPVHLLIDTSASMGVPAADAKLAFAVGLAAALAYVALRQGNPIRAVVLGDGRAGAALSPLLRHVQRLPELHAFLAAVSAQGPTRLQEGVDAYLRSTQLPGTAVVISDFLVEAPVYRSALDRLLGRGYDVVALRVLGAQERDPSALPRRVRLHDVETGAERVLELTTAHRHRYVAALDEHLATLKTWCAARTIRFATAETAGGLDACLLSDLPRAGLLQ
jgi:uncharacterized protein (DUF58 family)